MEIAHLAVFCGHGHAIEVVRVPHGLEVAANDQEVDAGPSFDLAGLLDRGVDGVEGAVAAAFDGQAHAAFFLQLDVGGHGEWMVPFGGPRKVREVVSGLHFGEAHLVESAFV